MIYVASIVVAFLSFVLALAWLVYSLEVLTGLAPLSLAPDVTSDCSIVVLIPAHNEAAGIGQAISRLMTVSEDAKILVIADNCDDDTARIAASAGAMVAERINPLRRGKGYA